MRVSTITQVARKAGVSLSTASDILNGKLKGKPETAARVRGAAKALGYSPNAQARGLRTAQTGAFGLVVPYRRSLFTSPVLTAYLSGVQKAQQAVGLHLMLASKSYDEPQDVYGADLFKGRSVDGLIVIGTRESYGRDLSKDVRALRVMKCPLVWLHHYNGDEPVDRVVGARINALQLALDHLKERKIKKVGFLLNSPIKGSTKARISKRYLDGARRTELVSKSRWVGFGESYDGSAFRAALELLRIPKRDRPDALICDSDDGANVALQVALGLGMQIPKELALVGLGDYGVGERAAVPITVVGAPASKLGEDAVYRLKSLIDKPGQAPETKEVSGGLIVRASSAR